MLQIVSSMFHSEGSVNSAQKSLTLRRTIKLQLTYLYGRAGGQEGACPQVSGDEAEEVEPGHLGGAAAASQASE